MRTIISTLLILSTFVQFSHAKVRTISNAPGGGAEYSSLETAYNEADEGDTLLLQGTDINYNFGIDFDKSLIIIGIGFNPDKQQPKQSIIHGTIVGLDFRLISGASGSRFYGIVFTNTVAIYGSSDNIVFENCHFQKPFTTVCNTVTNYVFRNCIFDNNTDRNIDLNCNSNHANMLFSNCLFDSYIDGQGSPYADLTFEHCIFLRSTAPFNNLYYAQIQNCIFRNAFPEGTFYSDFQNNLCAVPGTFPPSPANGNTASGNLENTDPQFINYTSGEFYSTLHDYDLQAGSAAIEAATNGTDIGVHGGYSNFSETGEVLIAPIIRELNILNTSVAPNGTLNVNVHATTPNGN